MIMPRWLLAVLSGLLMVLSSAPYDQWYLSYVAYVPLFLAARNTGSVERGMLFALACTLIAANWWHSTIIYSFLFFLLICGVLCLAFFIWGVLSSRYSDFEGAPVRAVVMPAILWVGIERILSSEWVGIPCNIGISQYGQPVLIQTASLFGIYTTSLFIVLVNSFLAFVVDRILAWKGQGWRPATGHRLATALSMSLIIANISYGAYRLESPPAEGARVKVAVVQPVISTDMYLNGWRDPDTRSFIRQTLDALTAEAASRQPDMLFWPEGGNGYFNMRIAELRDGLYATALKHDMDMLISSNDLDEDGRKFNAIFSISREGRLLGRYNKVQLIPGAEDAYTPGSGYHTVPSSYGPVGPAICYESNFPAPLREVSGKGAELLFVSTSDASFKKTALSINHTRTAIFRAVENNRWVIHASNTGPSVVVSPRGLVVAEKPFYQRGVIDAEAAFVSQKSIFTRFGYLLPELFAVVTILLSAVCVRDALPKWRLVMSGVGSRLSKESELQSLLSGGGRVVIRKYLPLTVAYMAAVAVMVMSSIMLVYARTEPGRPIHEALREFVEPLDTLRPDKVTQKFLQAKSNTCGPAVLAYVFSFFGKEVLEQDVVGQVVMTEAGTSMLELKKAATNNGFRAKGMMENYPALLEEPMPVIAYINDDHYVVVNKVTPYDVYLFDPAIGHVLVPRSIFEQAWNGYLLIIRMGPIEESLSSEARRELLRERPA